MHGLMIVTLGCVLGASGWMIFMTIILILSFIHYGQYHQWLKNNKSLVRVERDSNNKWTLIYSNNSQCTKLKLTSSYVSPQLVILYFSKIYFWQRSTVTIIVDAVDDKLFRHLRLYCRDPKTFQ